MEVGALVPLAGKAPCSSPSPSSRTDTRQERAGVRSYACSNGSDRVE